MKRIVTLISLGFFCAMFLGCSSNTDTPKTSNTPKTDSKTSSTSSISTSKKQKSKKTTQSTTIDLLTSAKTAKYFTSDQVSEDHIKQILQAGLNAPSARNSQPWHFTVVTNKDIINQINEAVIAGMPKGFPGGSSASQSKNDKQPTNETKPPKKLGLTDAPVAIFVYGTNNLPTDSYDCGLATEAMSIAALSLGYGTKILASPSIALNGEKKADFDKLLQIPEGYKHVGTLIIGHNDETIDASSSASKRFTMEEKVKFIN